MKSVDKTLPIDFDEEADEQDVAEQLQPGGTAAVVSGTDWTTETIVSQLDRKNIQLNPRFQRRDAWRSDRKSRFIESLIVGLPIPQIVLAESKTERGKFIVLDGKQRLLSILQFWGLGEGQNNKYALTGLTLRNDLTGITYEELAKSQKLEADYNALMNQAVRTVVIRNWKDSDFLHTVFLRLNTGSVTLSPQELRQALLPGPFSDYIDDASAKSEALKTLLAVTEPDPRMRDIEILARFLAFKFFSEQYPGRMKEFLDQTFRWFNAGWSEYKSKVVDAAAEFESGVEALYKVFGNDVARKPTSGQFNRAIFDALIYFHSQKGVRESVSGKTAALRNSYKKLFGSNTGFLQAIESDTAGAPNTAKRLAIWAKTLSTVTGKKVLPPKIPLTKEEAKHAAAKIKAKP